MANKTNYLLETLVWMKSKDASKTNPSHRPKPFVPEFMKQEDASGEINKGIEKHTTDDITALLAMPRG